MRNLYARKDMKSYRKREIIMLICAGLYVIVTLVLWRRQKTRNLSNLTFWILKFFLFYFIFMSLSYFINLVLIFFILFEERKFPNYIMYLYNIIKWMLASPKMRKKK